MDEIYANEIKTNNQRFLYSKLIYQINAQSFQLSLEIDSHYWLSKTMFTQL